jgi:hypothetical protein
MIYYQLLELFHPKSVLTPEGLGMIERWVGDGLGVEVRVRFTVPLGL